VPVPHWPNGNGQLVPALSTVLIDFPALCAVAAAMARIYVTAGAKAAPMTVAPASRPAIA
jgi:hypothetical protein